MCLKCQVNAGFKNHTKKNQDFNLNVYMYIKFLNKDASRNTFSLIFLKLGNYICNSRKCFGKQ